MPFGPTAYLRWATRHYGRVAFDLASSGMTALPQSELGTPASLEDWNAWDPLRAKIARYNGVAVDEAIPALGTTHAMWLAYASLLSAGDEALVEHPVYEPLVRISEGVGATVRSFSRDPSRGYALDADVVCRAITSATRVVALSSLHNPSGSRASDEAIVAIAREAATRGAYVVVDEVYAPFDALCDARGVWGQSARRLAPNVVATGSLTKCYGLGAHRVGWVLGSRDVIARAEDALVATLGHGPLPWMAFAGRAFDVLGDAGARARRLLGAKRATVEAWVRARTDLAWSAPREGLFGFAEVRGSNEDLRTRIERGIAEEQVIVAPGVFFGVKNGFRLGWGGDEAKLDEGLARLGRVLA